MKKNNKNIVGGIAIFIALFFILTYVGVIPDLFSIFVFPNPILAYDCQLDCGDSLASCFGQLHPEIKVGSTTLSFNRGIIVYDISNIPDNAVIKKIKYNYKLNYFGDSDCLNNPTLNIYSMDYNSYDFTPSSGEEDTLIYNGIISNTLVGEKLVLKSDEGNLNYLELNQEGINKLQSSLTSNYFVLGFNLNNNFDECDESVCHIDLASNMDINIEYDLSCTQNSDCPTPKICSNSLCVDNPCNTNGTCDAGEDSTNCDDCQIPGNQTCNYDYDCSIARFCIENNTLSILGAMCSNGNCLGVYNIICDGELVSKEVAQQKCNFNTKICPTSNQTTCKTLGQACTTDSNCCLVSGKTIKCNSNVCKEQKSGWDYNEDTNTCTSTTYYSIYSTESECKSHIKSTWTLIWEWIVEFWYIVLGAIVLLIILFWKKIKRWFK